MSDVNTVEGDQSIFDDSGAEVDSGNVETTTKAPVKKEEAETTEAVKDGQSDQSAASKDEGNQTGAKKAPGTPPEGEDADEESVTDDKGQKFIPEHRFKAALKKVTEERDAAQSKIAEYEKPQPVEAPDKETDPEGHALHMRMEQSQAVMRDLVPDYQEKIDHFAKMAESNPLLNQAVAAHAIPAKLAYDIAAKDMEIKEALNIKGSEDWKQFQEWKKTQKNQPPADAQTELNEKVTRGLGRSVPNLNRSTNASPNRNIRRNSNAGDTDDDLFKGAL